MYSIGFFISRTLLCLVIAFAISVGITWNLRPPLFLTVATFALIWTGWVVGFLIWRRVLIRRANRVIAEDGTYWRYGRR